MRPLIVETNRKKRFKNAMLTSLVALLLCSIPLGLRVWLQRNGAVEQDWGVVREFVLRDHNGAPLTRDHMRRAQTIVIYWPKSCELPQACDTALTTAVRLKDWVESSLRPKLTEERNPLILAVVGATQHQFQPFSGWRRFEVAALGGGSDVGILPRDVNLETPALIIVDNTLQFSGYFELTGPIEWQRVERVLSKTAFDQYLGNYLSRRTFMGPKRTQN